MSRRRGWIRRTVPWVLAFVVITATGYMLFQAMSERDLVQRASQLRIGDELTGMPPDPRSAIEVLDKLLARKPRHSEALIEKARAWADLRAWDKAVEMLDLASDSTDDVQIKIRATDMAMNLLAIAREFDDAFAMGDRLVALKPEKSAFALKLGQIYYRGSADSQAQATNRFVNPSAKRMKDVLIEEQIEAYVTDVWRTPDLDDLLDELLPEADAVLRRDIEEKLLTARTRFLSAYEILEDYRYFGGWDAAVARAYCQSLYRAGRLYDAHIEAGMALREPNLNMNLMRDFTEVQALCSVAIEDYGTAADTYARILDIFEQYQQYPPGVYVWWMYENRLRAGQYLWVLQNIDNDMQTYGKDVYMRYVNAVALAAAGRADEARLELAEPFAAVALGGKNFQPPSLRLFPKRRREVAMTCYELFDAVGDPRASQALDAVLALIPDDVEALRLRAELYLEKGNTEGAAFDAFDLLTEHRRDRGDFDLWMQASDALSEQRYGLSLSERAVTKVNESERWNRNRGDADFAIREALKNKRIDRPTFERLPDQLFVPSDPAFTFAIVRELTARNDVTRSRQELRKLSNSYPDVQEFRYRLGRLLVREGNFESAVAEFRRLLEDIPSDTEALDLATRTYRAMGLHTQAADLINLMILESPLEVGAVRYGHQLLDTDRPDQASRLVERLVGWTGFNQNLDVLLLAGDAKLALGDLKAASAILNTVAQANPDSVDVALLGLDLGLTSGTSQLVEAAINSLMRLAPELFPDQMEEVANRLLDAGLLRDILRVFPPEVTKAPAAQPALRAVARANKSLGYASAAEDLLALLDDDLALLDQFLLASLQRRTAEAAKVLRLTPALADERNIVELRLLVANALQGIPALFDQHIGRKLSELGVPDMLEPGDVQMLDALLRIMPSLDRLEDVAPAGAVLDAVAAWPLAGRDINLVLALSLEDPDTAFSVAENLLYLVLMGGRDFWARESRALAEQSLHLVPDLILPTRVLARRALIEERPIDALRLLQPLLDMQHGNPDLADLELFMDASRQQGRGEWGVVYAMRIVGEPGVRQLLADKLTSWEFSEEAIVLYRELLANSPGDRHALTGLLQAMVQQRQFDELADVARIAIAAHPEYDDLRVTCADALALIPEPDEGAVELMEALWDTFDDLPQIGEALARAYGGDPDRIDAVLQTMTTRIEARTDASAPESRQAESQALVRSATAARRWGLLERARKMNELALRITPGSVRLFSELAYLELEEGNLDTARRYLQVLSFTNATDRGTAMVLANLDFQRLGRPRRAAESVRRAFHGSLPPPAVEILAAEAYLLGRPDDAIQQFHAISRSPLLSADTFMTVARIAYSSGDDIIARLLFEQVLLTTEDGDPRRPRCEWLCEVRLPKIQRPGAEPEAAASTGDADPADATDGDAPAEGADPDAEPPPTAPEPETEDAVTVDAGTPTDP
jgi:tetratricopeptide (TPR) repeat protein